jgi:hypothetical protein
MNPFERLIQDLSALLGVPLHVEKGGLCRLITGEALKVHLEHEPDLHRILVASFILEIPPGKFREDILKEALKNNDSLDRFGVLAYSEKNNSLAYFLYLPDDLAPNRVSTALLGFIETAKAWKTAIETGQMHLIARH